MSKVVAVLIGLLLVAPCFAQPGDKDLIDRDYKALVDWRENHLANEIEEAKANLKGTQRSVKNAKAAAHYRQLLTELEKKAKEPKPENEFPTIWLSDPGRKIGYLNAKVIERVEGGYLCSMVPTSPTNPRDLNSRFAPPAAKVVILTQQKLLPDEETKGVWHYVGKQAGVITFEPFVEPQAAAKTKP